MIDRETKKERKKLPFKLFQIMTNNELGYLINDGSLYFIN
jgi:hypothetical protein